MYFFNNILLTCVLVLFFIVYLVFNFSKFFILKFLSSCTPCKQCKHHTHIVYQEKKKHKPCMCCIQGSQYCIIKLVPILLQNVPKKNTRLYWPISVVPTFIGPYRPVFSISASTIKKNKKLKKNIKKIFYLI